MRKFFSLFMILLVTFGLMIHTADAGRFGGGRSFGMQRSVGGYGSTFSRAQAAPGQFARQPSALSRWAGPLAGLAVGGLLASLFMGHGLGTGLFSWLIVGGIVLLVFNFLRRMRQPAAQSNFGGHRNNIFNATREQDVYSSYTSNQPYAQAPLSAVPPAGFDKESFLREVKVQFIRLQAAYDKKDLNDLHAFTTPEVFGEVQLELQERGNAENITEVVSLDAQLLEATNEYQATIASVRFLGLIKEDKNNPVSFNEIWHFRKENAGERWLVAGIQQQA